MALTVGLILMTLAAAAALFSAVVPLRHTMRVTSAANTFQLHTIPLLGIYPSMALLGWLALWPAALDSRLWRWTWMRALAALAAVQALSILWAPTPMLGLRHLIYMAPLALAAHGFYRLTLERPRAAYNCLRLLLLPTAGVAILVMLFRALPSLELRFLTHPVAGLFVSPNTIEGLFGTARNNVLDPAKAGGLFVNANIASTFLGMSAIAAWFLSRAYHSITLRLVAVIDWTAVLATGSKAGLMFAIAVPALMAVIGIVRARQADPLRLFAMIVALIAIAVVLALPFSRDLLDEYRSETLATLGSRDELWQYAVQMITQRPLTGLGFGGWEKMFELHAFLTGTGVMPAHNSLLILWLQSGAPGLVAGIVVIGTIYAAASRVLGAEGSADRQLAMALVGSFTWYVGQGMGENFGLVGEAHMTPLLGALLGYVCAHFDASHHPETENVSEPVRGCAAPSAVPAV